MVTKIFRKLKMRWDFLYVFVTIVYFSANFIIIIIISSLLLYSRFLTSFLCLHPSLTSAARLSATKVIIICQIM